MRFRGWCKDDAVNLANRITTLRIFLIPVFCLLVFLYSPNLPWMRHAALMVYGIAALTDVLDGMVARRFGQQTALGMRLDPLADKLLINLGFVFLAANPDFSPGVPMWFPLPVLVRDCIVVLGALLLNAFVGPVTINVRATGKLTTIFLNGTLLAALLEVPFLSWLLGIATLLVVASCAEYIRDGIRQLNAARGRFHE